MQLFATDILLLLLLLVTSSSQQCNSPILRNVIQGSDLESEFLGNLGTDRVPLLNQSEALVIRFNGFSLSPVFYLGLTPYDITAIDIQFGRVGQCVENGEIIDMERIRIGNGDPFVFENVPLEIGYAVDNIMNLTELGNPNQGRIIRFRIITIRGRYIIYPFRTTNPPGENTNVVTLCLRTELYGCISTAPITNIIFLQYNLIEPTVYTDSMYTGVTSMGYMSGGEGLLNDGSIGTSPITDSAQWLGWSNPDLDNPEVLFLFSRDVTISNISVFYWGETSSDISVEISSAAGVETVLSEITQNNGSVFRRIYLYAGFATGLLKLNFVGASTILLTEIEIQEPSRNNLLGPRLDTSRFTAITASTTTTTTTTTTIITTEGMTAPTTRDIIVTNSNTHTTSQTSLTTELTTQTTQTTTEATTQTADALNKATNTIIKIVLAICLLISGIINLIVGIAVCVYCCYNKRRGMLNDNIGHKDIPDNVVMQPMQEYEYVDIQPVPKPDYIDMQPGGEPDYIDIQPGGEPDYIDIQPGGERGYQSLGIEEVIEYVNNTQGQGQGYYEIN